MLPIVEYPHALGCSVTGGFRSRGSALSAHVGTYFFADFCTGRVWGATTTGDGSWRATQLLDTNLQIATFGEDAAGDLYVGTYGAGELYRLTDAPSRPRLTIAKIGTGAGLIESKEPALYCGTICGVEAGSGTFTLVVTPDEGSVFDGWSGDADCTDGTVSLMASRTCIARLMVPGAFTDETLTPGTTPIRAVHIAELRERIDAQRVRFKRQPFAWTDPSLGAGATSVRAVHIVELRAALAGAYAAAGRAAPSYTDGNLTTGVPVRAVHISELRTAVRGLESVQ